MLKNQPARSRWLVEIGLQVKTQAKEKYT